MSVQRDDIVSPQLRVIPHGRAGLPWENNETGVPAAKLQEIDRCCSTYARVPGSATA
jgi:hypothetical protein